MCPGELLANVREATSGNPGGRPVALLFANAGRGLGEGFLDQDLDEARKVIDLNVTSTVRPIHAVGRPMRNANEGRITRNTVIGVTSRARDNGDPRAPVETSSWSARQDLKLLRFGQACSTGDPGSDPE